MAFAMFVGLILWGFIIWGFIRFIKFVFKPRYNFLELLAEGKIDIPPHPPRTDDFAHKLPYHKKDYLLSSAEREFYLVLKKVAEELNLTVFAKVRLEDLIWIPRFTYNMLKWRGYVRSRHIDFVLCSNEYVQPLLAVELDDSSHLRPDRIERDEKIDRILGDAGLPILHVRCQYSYQQNILLDEIKKAISPKIHSS